jgi:hypothetical protein
MVLSVCPLAGAGTGSLISSLGAMPSALARAPISEMLSSASSPRSICDSFDLLIPAKPATTRSDFFRASRISR